MGFDIPPCNEEPYSMAETDGIPRKAARPNKNSKAESEESDEEWDDEPVDDESDEELDNDPSDPTDRDVEKDESKRPMGSTADTAMELDSDEEVSDEEDDDGDDDDDPMDEDDPRPKPHGPSYGGGNAGEAEAREDEEDMSSLVLDAEETQQDRAVSIAEKESQVTGEDLQIDEVTEQRIAELLADVRETEDNDEL